VITEVPAALRGLDWVRSANDSKSCPRAPLATLTLRAAGQVLVAVDSRMVPHWIADEDWTDTGTIVGVRLASLTAKFRVFRRSFPAGPVRLGPIRSITASMYLVIVK
jgi:hypothetical protein